MAGLDNIQKYEDGGEVETSMPAAAPSSGALPMKLNPKTGALMPSAKEIVADPEQASELLKNMERMIAEKSDPWRGFQNSLARASAWAVPSLGGQKAQALTTVAQQQDKESQDLFSMRQQLAGIKAAQSSANNDSARLASVMGGGAGGVGGTGDVGGAIPGDVLARMQVAKTDADRLAVLDEWRKGRIIEQNKKEFSPAMAGMVDAFNKATGEYEQMTLAEFEKMRQSYPNVYQKAVPTKSPTIISSDAATRNAARESGGNTNIGFHDPAKSSAYGTYGLTTAAYKDVQNANPKFQGRDITSLKPEEQTEAFNTYRGLAQNQFGKLGVEPTAQNLDLAHFLGPAGAANYLKTGTISPEAAASNGGEAKTKQIANGILSGKTTPATTQTSETVVTTPKASNRQEYEQQLAIQKDIQTARVKEGETERGNVLSNYRASTEGLNALNKVESILNTPEGRRAVGVLQNPGVANALAGILKEGVTAGNFGSVGFKGIEDAARKAKYGQAEIDAAQKLAREFAQMQLKVAQRDLKGQGAVSDNERKLVSHVTGDITNSPKVLDDFVRWNKARTQYDKEVGDAMQKFDRTNPNAPHSAFEQSAEFQKIKQSYVDKTDRMVQSMGLSGSKNESKGSHPADDLISKYQTKK